MIEAEEISSPADDARYAGAPAETSTLVSLLMAHHTEDLPDAKTLHAHSEAEASLLWRADHGDRLVLRVRAIASLRFLLERGHARGDPALPRGRRRPPDAPGRRGDGQRRAAPPGSDPTAE